MTTPPPSSSDDISSISSVIAFVRDWAGIMLGSGALGIVWRSASTRADLVAKVNIARSDIDKLKDHMDRASRDVSDLRESVAKLPTRLEIAGQFDTIRQDIREINRPVRD